MTTIAQRLMVMVPDRITDILVKGEYQPNYYNPGELFEEVHIVTTTDDRPDLEALQRTVGRARLVVHNLPENSELIGKDWTANDFQLLREWAHPGVELARRIRPQLIRCHGADWNAYLASQIRAVLGIPYTISLHINPDVNSVRRYLGPAPTPAQQRQNVFFEYLEGTGLRSADVVMPVYRPILPYLSRHRVDRVEVCYNILNGPYLRQKTSYAKGERFKIVCVGRLFDDKNPAPLIRAVAELGGIDLTIVGDGPERPRLEQLVAELGVESAVQFRPAVPNDELCDILPSFDAFAVHTEYWELNKSVLEALLTGLPVVINRRNGPPVPELEGVDFVRFVDNTAESYRDAIRELIANNDAREALGRRAYEHAQANWSPEATETRVVNIYQRLLMRVAA